MKKYFVKFQDDTRKLYDAENEQDALNKAFVDQGEEGVAAFEKTSANVKQNDEELNQAIIYARTKVYKKESPYLAGMYQAVAPSGFEKSMQTGSMGLNIEDVKDVAPTIIGTAAGLGAGALATKLVPSIVRAAPVISKLAQVGVRQIAPALIEQGVTDFAEMPIQGKNSSEAFQPLDYGVAGVGAGVGSSLELLGPMSKQSLIKRLEKTGQFVNDEGVSPVSDIELTAKHAFQEQKYNTTNKSGVVVSKERKASVVTFLQDRAKLDSEDLNKSIIIKQKESQLYPKDKTVKFMIKEMEKQIADRNKNLARQIEKVKSDDGYALGIAKEMESDMLSGEYRVGGFNKPTVKQMTARPLVDAPNNPFLQKNLDDLERMRVQGSKLQTTNSPNITPASFEKGIMKSTSDWFTPSVRTLYNVGELGYSPAVKQSRGLNLLTPIATSISNEDQ